MHLTPSFHISWGLLKSFDYLCDFLHRIIMPFQVTPPRLQLALQKNIQKSHTQPTKNTAALPPPNNNNKTHPTMNYFHLLSLMTAYVVGCRGGSEKKMSACSRFPLFKLSGNRKERVPAAILSWQPVPTLYIFNAGLIALPDLNYLLDKNNTSGTNSSYAEQLS